MKVLFALAVVLVAFAAGWVAHLWLDSRDFGEGVDIA